jgi:DNA-binding transcriptional LysR family regulator
MIELSTFEAVKAFALQGVGIGVLPKRVARADTEAGRLRGLTVPGAPADFGEHRIVAAMHARDRGSPRVARILEEMKRYAAGIAGP